MNCMHNIILFGEIENLLAFPQDWQKSLLRVVLNVAFVCLEYYRSLLLISQNKILADAWVPSSMEQKYTLAIATKTPPRHHYHYFYTNTATFMIPKTRFNIE